MLVVITIIGLIMALVGPRVLNYLSESKVKAARIQIESFSSALDLFYLDNGRYPTSSEGLPALVQRPANSLAWNGPYLKTASVPADPWGRPYKYRSPGDHAPYEISSAGPGGKFWIGRRRGDQEHVSIAAMRRDAGFTLIEVVCVLAIIALIAALVLPAIPRATSRARLEAYALEAAALLTADRNAAIRRRTEIATALDANARAIRSGTGAGRILLPRDVAFDALLAQTCNGRNAGATIDFFPSGRSCGGTIELRRGNVGYQVRVNWLTRGAEVVSLDAAAK